MSAVLYIQVNIFAIIVLSILWFHFRQDRADKFLSDQRVFEWMLLNNIVILILDVGTGILEGQSFEGAYTINMIVTSLYYAVNPLMGFLYCVFCEIKLGISQDKLRKWIPVYLVPLFANLLFCISNTFIPMFFIISNENLYGRGPLFPLSFVFSYILIFYIFFKVLYKMKRTDKYSNQRKTYWALLVFPVAPIIGGVLQIYMLGVSIIWVSTVISLLIIYVNIQNTQMSTDTLTELFNRKQMMPYLDWKTSEKNIRKGKKKELYIILIDIDNLKYINDNYGHVAGDEALVSIAESIKNVVRKDDFAGRYGGDEFIIIAERNNEAEIKGIISDISSRLDERNKNINTGYDLSVSAGYAMWERKYDDIKDTIAFADERMYQEKKRKLS